MSQNAPELILERRNKKLSRRSMSHADPSRYVGHPPLHKCKICLPFNSIFLHPCFFSSSPHYALFSRYPCFIFSLFCLISALFPLLHFYLFSCSLSSPYSPPFSGSLCSLSFLSFPHSPLFSRSLCSLSFLSSPHSPLFSSSLCSLTFLSSPHSPLFFSSLCYLSFPHSPLCPVLSVLLIVLSIFSHLHTCWTCHSLSCWSRCNLSCWFCCCLSHWPRCNVLFDPAMYTVSPVGPATQSLPLQSSLLTLLHSLLMVPGAISCRLHLTVFCWPHRECPRVIPSPNI